MTEPTLDTTTAADAGNDDDATFDEVVARAEPMLRDHEKKSSQHLHELETDIEGLNSDGSIQEDRDSVRRLIESVRSDLLRTQRAIERIDADAYGLCTTCKEQIAPARLSAIPEAEHCTRCA